MLSIKPEYAEKILNGTKRYEYRRKVFNNDISKVFLYATRPKGEIVGYFSPAEILFDKSKIIWEKTADFSGLTKEAFLSYCHGLESIYAISISKAVRLPEPINPYQIAFKPPQSFYYV